MRLSSLDLLILQGCQSFAHSTLEYFLGRLENEQILLLYFVPFSHALFSMYVGRSCNHCYPYIHLYTYSGYSYSHSNAIPVLNPNCDIYPNSQWSYFQL